ncbi:hypothetical protein A2J03_03115 [Rhodococcus sp. EPR-157]|nr:hypothetical protein A2J03_03115 [Rhodococcus sp. EPR-157]
MDVKRLPVTLDSEDQAEVAVFSDPNRLESAILREWAQQNHITVRDNSESGIVRALLRAGAESLREKALETGYAALAKDQEDGLGEQRTRGPVQPERPVTVAGARRSVPLSCVVAVGVLRVGRFLQQIGKWHGQVDVDSARSGACPGVQVAIKEFAESVGVASVWCACA